MKSWIPTSRRYSRILYASAIVFFALPHATSAQSAQAITVDLLLSFNTDWSSPHEGQPMGVPQGFDWASKPRIGAGNTPGKFAAATGWGHAFWSKDAVGHPGRLQIRNFRTFMCSGLEKSWNRVQTAPLEGAEFRADFKNNASTPARYSSDGLTTTVLFDAGKTFHFWPAKGRARLPRSELCGFVVILEARTVDINKAVPSRTGGYLIGLGADYWVDSSSPWDNFKTNTDVGIGRLKHVGKQWSWYGMSTASDADLKRLFDSGLLNYPVN